MLTVTIASHSIQDYKNGHVKLKPSKEITITKWEKNQSFCDFYKLLVKMLKLPYLAKNE